MSFQDFMMKIAGDESLFVAFLVGIKQCKCVVSLLDLALHRSQYCIGWMADVMTDPSIV